MMLDPGRKSSDNQQPQQRLLARFRGVAAILAKARPGIGAPLAAENIVTATARIFGAKTAR